VKPVLGSPALCQEKHVPQDASLIGMSALVHALNVDAPVRKPACLSAQLIKRIKIAFGFVYIHPYEDDNGRLHRCLIHLALSQKKFSPPGLVFPVSSVMLKWIEQYRTVLQSHSAPLMNFIHWVPTIRGNVQVRNDTADLYRFFDCTEAAEFLYRCVEETVENDLPREIDYLKRHDRAMQQIMDTVEMPNRTAENFIMFMRRNNWRLPKNRRRDEFEKLTDTEADALANIVRTAFYGSGVE
jgi:hypothetical protein